MARVAAACVPPLSGANACRGVAHQAAAAAAAANAVVELRQEFAGQLRRSREEVHRVRLEASQQYEQLRVENHELRAANVRLAEDMHAREKRGVDASVLATLDERNRTVARGAGACAAGGA